MGLLTWEKLMSKQNLMMSGAPVVLALSLIMSASVFAESDQEADETGQVAADDIPGVAALEEEVNTNDPTAAAISVSMGWEFFNWHEDEIAPGQTRPVGNDNNFNSRFVIPLAKGTLGSPWPIINRFSFANVEGLSLNTSSLI